MLNIWLLGQFAAQLDGRRVELASRAAQSLFSYLALTAGHAHRREHLAGLIWPEAVEASARRNLRQALWQIRKALQAAAQPGEVAAFLLADDIQVAFDAHAAYRLDAAQLDAPLIGSLGIAALIETVGAYGGELLPGFYDEWVILERERLQAVFERKISLLVRGLSAGNRWDEVLHWAERWIRLAHAPEAAYAALLQAQAALGDHGSLSTTYRRCVEALRRELSLEPAAATRALYEQLVSARPAEASLRARYPLGKDNAAAVRDAGAGLAGTAWDGTLQVAGRPPLS